jgi:glycosyltransferase involved in cell wall biosynthesis
MKKLLFSAYDMNIGGIETSLLTLLNTLVEKDYDITLVLEKKQGVFLSELDSKIHIVEYAPSEVKPVFVRKILNGIKRINFTLKYKNKFDFSASYATYSNMASFVARVASKNNALWAHADYLELFNGNAIKMESFFNNLKVQKFQKIVFVCKAGAESFIKIFPNLENRVTVCNNLIDYNKIQNLSNIEITEEKSICTFVNVGRHDEKQKKLSRIIEVAKKLKSENYQFKVWFIGNGEDTNKYKELVRQYNLEAYIEFLGAKKNPYQYIKMADCVILTSEYEGYPVVFNEAMVLNKPIITTDVADAVSDIQNKFGIVTNKTEEDIYNAMKEFIENGYTIKEKFDAQKYNNSIMENIKNIIGV